MAHKLEPAHLMQARRKWSDWSECSVSCLKTRHRLNCDDLLAAQNITVGSTKLQTKPINDIKPSANERTRKRTSQEEGDQDDEMLKSQDVQNNEDDDYADEGDEADEVDSCDSVLDTSKTFEQQTCSDGLCRFSSASGQPASDIKQQAAPNRPRPIGTRARKPNSLRSRPPELVSSTSIDQEPRVDLQLDTTADRYRGQNSKQTNLAQRGTDVLTFANNGSSSELSGGEPTLNSNSSSIWTRNMWPNHLNVLDGQNGAQVNLIIQWTILIGCLLTTVLLVALLLRKLFLSMFPSYHRMLAKQTIKSSSANQMDSVDCCPHHNHQRHPPGGSTYPSTVDPLGPPHIRHFEGSWSGVCPAFSPATLYGDRGENCKNFPRGTFQQFVLDSGGRHVMVAESIGAKFNTDASLGQFQVADNNVAACNLASTTKSSSSSGSASGHCRRSRYAHCHTDGGSAKLIANCHYDTLDCTTKTTNMDHQHCESIPVDYRQDVGFYLTHDFVPFTADLNPCRMKGGRSSIGDRLGENPDRSSNSQSLDRERPGRRRNASPADKHESPNVPQAASEDEDNEEPEGNLQDRRPSDAHSSGGSSSIDNSSPSVQSTTAPVLSNAGSSSFEQPPELSDYAAPLEPPATPLASVSAGASPAVGKTPRRVTKVVRQSIAAQSQPNSPMFVNQFASSRSKQRHTNNSKPSSMQRHKLRSRKQPQEQVVVARDAVHRSGDNCYTENEDLQDDERHYYEEIDRQNFS